MCINWREHDCLIRLIVKVDKYELRKIHACQRFKKRVKNASAPVVIDVDQFASYFIEQAASDFTKFPHVIDKNILYEISKIGNCFLSNFPKQRWVFLCIQALCSSICNEIFGKITSSLTLLDP
ncbi:hypothetical protein MXB_4288 [Myxobolus squamalis]|nr:hypothetical protein MXB_4288 [Myxobolus squamalis]